MGKNVIEALKEINIHINKGDFIAIVGPSGSGKTSLLNILGLLDKPTSGDIIFDSKNITNYSKDQMADIRSQKIGFIFQNFNLIQVFNIYENIETALITKRLSKKERKDLINKIIDDINLKEFAYHKPSELSGGQRQRVAIARALVKNPEIVLADEPTANLDSKTALMIIELMLYLNKKYNTTFIFATHDNRLLQHINIIYQLDDGVLKSISK